MAELKSLNPKTVWSHWRKPKSNWEKFTDLFKRKKTSQIKIALTNWKNQIKALWRALVAESKLQLAKFERRYKLEQRSS